jgi:hypothetical protein
LLLCMHVVCVNHQYQLLTAETSTCYMHEVVLSNSRMQMPVVTLSIAVMAVVTA